MNTFTLDTEGEADVELVTRALEQANETFNGANINSAVTFALSFLVSMIVIYERHTDQVGQFDVDELRDKIHQALEAVRSEAAQEFDRRSQQ